MKQHDQMFGHVLFFFCYLISKTTLNFFPNSFPFLKLSRSKKGGMMCQWRHFGLFLLSKLRIFLLKLFKNGGGKTITLDGQQLFENYLTSIVTISLKLILKIAFYNIDIVKIPNTHEQWI